MVETRAASKRAEASGSNPAQPSNPSFAQPTAASSAKRRGKNPANSKQPGDPIPDPPDDAPKTRRSNPRRKRTTVAGPGTPSGSEDDDEDPDAGPDFERTGIAPPKPRSRKLALDRSWREYLEEYWVNRDEMLRYTRQIFDVLENNSLRAAPPEKASRDRLDQRWEALLLPPNQAKNTVSSGRADRQKTRGIWEIVLTLDERRTIMLDQKTARVKIPFDWVPEDARPTAQKIAQEYMNLMNRWRWDNTGNRRLSHLFLEAAYRKVTNRNERVCTSPTFDANHSKGRPVEGRLVGIVSALEQTEVPIRYVFLYAHHIPEGFDLASIPDPLFGTKWGSIGDNTDTPESCKPTGKLPPGWTDEKFAAGEKFLRFFISAAHGLVLSPKQLDQLLNFHLKNVFGTKHHRGGSANVYGQYRLFGPHLMPLQKCYGILPGNHVLGDLGFAFAEKHKFLMRVKSTLASRVVSPLDVGYKTYSLHVDPRRAILACAEALDLTNIDIADGVPPETGCGCNQAQSGVEFHPCAKCLLPTLCKSLTINHHGVRVCEECVGEEDKNVERLAKTFIANQLKRLTKLEAEQSGRDFADTAHQQNLQACIDELVEALPDQSKGPCYVDGFTDNKVVNIPQEIATSGRKVHPDTMSIDAKFLRVHVEGIGLVGHAPGNVHTTRDPVNRAKFIWPPGVLQLVTNWVRLAEKTQDDARQLMQRMTDMQVVACKTPYWTSTRNNQKVSDAELRRQVSEIIGGRPSPGEQGPWDAYAQRWVHDTVQLLIIGDEDSYIWEKRLRDGLLSVTTGFERLFGITLQRSADGCPFIGLKGFMELGYNWNSVAVFCRERLERMRVLCNRKHLTEDSVYALFAEMIRSACIDQACIEGKCPEEDSHLLHLPKRLTVKHPLRLSVAHKHHGRQMVTGWPEEPSHINQRDSEANNILMETWLENWTKLDLDEKFYELLRQIFLELAVPKSLYDPGRQPSAADTDGILANALDVDENAEVVSGPIAAPVPDEDDETGATTSAPSNSGAFGLPAGSASNPPPGGAAGSTSYVAPTGAATSLTYSLNEADYEDLVATDLVSVDSVFYGQVLVVNGQSGYARADGNFRTTSGTIIGKFDDEGNYFPLAGKFVKPYTGDLRMAKMMYHQQFTSLVGGDSRFRDVVLVDSSGGHAFASTSGEFLLENFTEDDRIVVGHFNEATGVITDMDGLEVGHVDILRDAPYQVVHHMLTELSMLTASKFTHDDQVQALRSKMQGSPANIERRILSLPPEGHPFHEYVLVAANPDHTDTSIVAFPHVDGRYENCPTIWRNCETDEVIGLYRDSALYDVNGIDLGVRTVERPAPGSGESGGSDGGESGGSGGGESGGSGTGDGGHGGANPAGGGGEASLIASNRAFSSGRTELSDLVPEGHAMDSIVLRHRNEAGQDELCFPSDAGLFLAAETGGHGPTQHSVASRWVGNFEPVGNSGDHYVITDTDGEEVAHVRLNRAGAWILH